MKRLLLILFMLMSSSILRANSQQYQWSILGHYSLMQQKPQASQAYYQKLLSSSQSPYPYSGYVRFLFATNQLNIIASLIPKLEESFKDDLDMQLMFAQALAGTGKKIEAETRFIQLQQKHKDNAELTYQAAQAHAKHDPKKSILVIDEFLNSTPFQPRNCLFYFMKSQHYMALNDKKSAIQNAQKSLDICPRFDKGWLLLGMLHEQEGKINEAVKGYSTFLELTGPNKEIEHQISSLLLKSKLQKGSTSSHLSYLTNALTWYENQEFEKALMAIDRSLQADPANQDARLLKINILSAMNKITNATDLLQQWMSEEPSNETWFKTLHLLYKAGLHKDKAIAVLHAVEQKNPQELLVVLYLADAYMRAHLFPSALSYHEKALTLTNDPLLKTKIAFNMGMIHFETNNITAMKEVLEQSKQYGAPFPPMHNLLAYYYATHGRDLARAQSYLDQALKIDANNPHFLDTQALIWYKKRDYAQAEKLLKKLAKQEPEDYFIHLHLAKTENKLGKQKQSMLTLNKATLCAPTDGERTLCKKLLKVFETTT